MVTTPGFPKQRPEYPPAPLLNLSALVPFLRQPSVSERKPSFGVNGFSARAAESLPPKDQSWQPATI